MNQTESQTASGKINVTRGGCPCDASSRIPDKRPITAVELRPTDFAPLFGRDLGSTFLLVTSPTIRSSLNVVADPECEIMEESWTGPECRARVVAAFDRLRAAGQRFTVLWIADDEFEHYLPEQLEGAKLAAISYFSGSFSTDSLARCLRIVRETDYAHEAKLEEQFLGLLDRGRRIVFRSPLLGLEAVFEHLRADHWFSLHGALSDGQQVVLPTGELSALTNASGEYSFNDRFTMNGSILLKGMPVVHRGSRAVTSEETDQAFSDLSKMADFPVVATVVDGLITEIRSAVSGANPFLGAIEGFFSKDERYRKIHEIGFGTNRMTSPLADYNFFPNERYPGVHFGIGLGGYTQFHHDLVCTETDVLIEVEKGEMIDVHRSLGLREGTSRAGVRSRYERLAPYPE